MGSPLLLSNKKSKLIHPFISAIVNDLVENKMDDGIRKAQTIVQQLLNNISHHLERLLNISVINHSQSKH
jgi:hypothetical protein